MTLPIQTRQVKGWFLEQIESVAIINPMAVVAPWVKDFIRPTRRSICCGAPVSNLDHYPNVLCLGCQREFAIDASYLRFMMEGERDKWSDIIEIMNP